MFKSFIVMYEGSSYQYLKIKTSNEKGIKTQPIALIKIKFTIVVLQVNT